MKTKKLDKKLTLNKKTIVCLPKKDMKEVYGGVETMVGPRCQLTLKCW